MVQAEASAGREVNLPAEDCRAQLNRILKSADFEATDREHRFLSFAEGGYEVDAERERAWLEANEPALLKNLRQEASTRLARSEDVESLLGSLRKAGLDIED